MEQKILTNKEMNTIKAVVKCVKKDTKIKQFIKEEDVEKIAKRYYVKIKKVEINDPNVIATLTKEDIPREKLAPKKRRTIYINNELNGYNSFAILFLIGYCVFNNNNNYVYSYTKNHLQKKANRKEFKAFYFAKEMVEMQISKEKKI